MVARRSAPKGRLKAFAIEPEVTINNQWSNRYTVIEVTGLDRPGLLYELTATLSKLSLNIASAHVATFGERVVDVFYVTDLLGAKIASPTRAGGDQARAAAAVRAGWAASRSQSRGGAARRSKTSAKSRWLVGLPGLNRPLKAARLSFGKPGPKHRRWGRRSRLTGRTWQRRKPRIVPLSAVNRYSTWPESDLARGA